MQILDFVTGRVLQSYSLRGKGGGGGREQENTEYHCIIGYNKNCCNVILKKLKSQKRNNFSIIPIDFYLESGPFKGNADPMQITVHRDEISV